MRSGDPWQHDMLSGVIVNRTGEDTKRGAAMQHERAAGSRVRRLASEPTLMTPSPQANGLSCCKASQVKRNGVRIGCGPRVDIYDLQRIVPGSHGCTTAVPNKSAVFIAPGDKARMIPRDTQTRMKTPCMVADHPAEVADRCTTALTMDTTTALRSTGAALVALQQRPSIGQKANMRHPARSGGHEDVWMRSGRCLRSATIRQLLASPCTHSALSAPQVSDRPSIPVPEPPCPGLPFVT